MTLFIGIITCFLPYVYLLIMYLNIVYLNIVYLNIEYLFTVYLNIEYLFTEYLLMFFLFIIYIHFIVPMAYRDEYYNSHKNPECVCKTSIYHNLGVEMCNLFLMIVQRKAVAVPIRDTVTAFYLVFKAILKS